MQLVNYFEESTNYLAYKPTGELLCKPTKSMATVRQIASRFLRGNLGIEKIVVFYIEPGEMKPKYKTTIRRKGARLAEQVMAIGKGAGARG